MKTLKALKIILLTLVLSISLPVISATYKVEDLTDTVYYFNNDTVVMNYDSTGFDGSDSKTFRIRTNHPDIVLAVYFDYNLGYKHYFDDDLKVVRRNINTGDTLFLRNIDFFDKNTYPIILSIEDEELVMNYIPSKTDTNNSFFLNVRSSNKSSLTDFIPSVTFYRNTYAFSSEKYGEYQGKLYDKTRFYFAEIKPISYNELIISDSIEASVFISTDSILSIDDYLLKRTKFSPQFINGNNTHLEHFIVFDTITEGDYYLMFVIDPENKIAEQNETNNTIIQPTKIIHSDYQIEILEQRIGNDNVLSKNEYDNLGESGYGLSGTYSTNISLHYIPIYQYYSKNAILDSNDIFLENLYTNVFAPGKYAREYEGELYNSILYSVSRTKIESLIPVESGVHYLISEIPNYYDSTKKSTFTSSFFAENISDPKITSFYSSKYKKDDKLSIFYHLKADNNTSFNRSLYGNSAEFYLSHDSVLNEYEDYLISVKKLYSDFYRDESWYYVKDTIEIDTLNIGDYYIIAKLKIDSSIVDFNFNNNITFTKFNIDSIDKGLNPNLSPLLKITDLYTRYYYNDSEPHIIANCENKGQVPVNNIKINTYLSKDSLIDNTDTLVYKLKYGSLLYPYQSISGGKPLMKKELYNNYNYIITTIEGSYESTKTYDTAFVQHNIPKFLNISDEDLSIHDVSIEYKDISVLYRFDNIDHIDQITSCDLYISKDSILDINDEKVQSKAINITSRNGFEFLEFERVYPIEDEGKYVIVRLDGYNTFKEKNETNNIFKQLIAIDQEVNISEFYNITPAKRFFNSVNKKTTIKFDSRLTTFNNIKSYSVNMEYYLSKDMAFDSTDLLLSKDSLFLYGDSEKVYNYAIEVDSLNEGIYFIVARANSFVPAKPYRLSSNKSVTMIQVINTNKSIGINEIKPEFLKNNWGSIVNVNSYFKNENDNSIVTNLSYYLSKDSIIDNSDTQLYSNETFEIIPGSNTLRLTELQLPLDFDTGHYYLIALIDSKNEFTGEANYKTSNCKIEIIDGKNFPKLRMSNLNFNNFNGLQLQIVNDNLNTHISTSPTEVYCYFSSDSILDSSDTLLDNYYVESFNLSSHSQIINLDVEFYSMLENFKYLIIKSTDCKLRNHSTCTTTIEKLMLIVPNNLVKIDLSPKEFNISTNSFSLNESFTFNVPINFINTTNKDYYIATTISISKDSIINSFSDVIIHHSEKETKASFEINETGKLPFDIDNGYYYVIVHVDSDKEIKEISEYNNILIGGIIKVSNSTVSYYPIEMADSIPEPKPIPSNYSISTQLPDSAIVGNDFTYSILADSLQSEDNIISYQFTLQYDTSILDYRAYNISGTLSDGGSIFINPVNDILHVSYANTNKLVGSGVLMQLNFKGVIDDTASFALSTLLLNTDTVITHEESIIKIVPEPVESPTLLYGDVDFDGSILAYDAALALQYSVGLDPLPSIDPLPWGANRIKVANVNGIGSITAYDASLILQYSAKVIDKFPVEYSTKSANIAQLDITTDNEYIYFNSLGGLYGLNINVVSRDNVILGNPNILITTNTISAINVTNSVYKVGIASSGNISSEVKLLKIPYSLVSKENGNIAFELDINGNPYEVEINLNGKSTTESPQITGVSAQDIEKVNIYPNPVKGSLTVSQGTDLQWKRFVIVDISGKMVKQGYLQSANEAILLNELSKGYYTIKIYSTEKSIQRKLIILE